MATHGLLPLYAAEHLPALERLYVLHELPLDCNDSTLGSFSHLHDSNKLQNEVNAKNERLKIHLFRISPKFPKTVNRGTIKYKLAYRDITIASSLETDQIPEHLKTEIMGYDYKSLIKDSIRCDFDAISQNLKLLVPEILSGQFVISSVSETYVQFDENISDSSVDVHNSAENNIDTREPIELYPWVSNFQLKVVNIAEPILVLEKSDCTNQGNFFIVSTGKLLDAQHDELREKLSIVRSQIYAANHYYGESGDPNTRHVVENSVDPTHYWCVPKKEFCYREIEFGKFGVNVSKNQAEKVDASRVYNLRLGIVSALQLIATERCSNEKD